MSDLLKDKVRMEGRAFGICQDGNWTELLLDNTELDALRWMVKSDTEASFSRKVTEWEVFMGPYINGSETGYIFQAINVYSRNVTTVTIPFKDEVNVKTVKQALTELLFEGGSANGEEKEETVHKEL